MRVASLFAGIGGFEVAAEKLGHEVVLQAESDPYAQAVLREHWPSVTLTSDATKADLRGIDLVTAGFPCQGLSIAAATRKHGGLLDEKSMSYVVWRVLDQIERARPGLLLFENASALGTKRYKPDLDALTGRLEEMGYHPRLVLINAGCYGTPQRRLRSFILCRREPWTQPATGGGISWTCDADGVGVNMAQGGAVFCGQPSVTKKAASYNCLITPEEVRSLAPDGVEKLFGFERGWTLAAGSNAQRYIRLGNAVAVPAAVAALQLLLGEVPQMRRPDWRYSELLPLSRPSPPGTSASGIGRIVRSIRIDRGALNALELSYCLPVYLRIARRSWGKLNEKMRGYVRDIEAIGIEEKPWPETATVSMRQLEHVDLDGHVGRRAGAAHRARLNGQVFALVEPDAVVEVHLRDVAVRQRDGERRGNA
jgi:site-specific DNA-cytosine methylase